jgi:hypothetical protein
MYKIMIVIRLLSFISHSFRCAEEIRVFFHEESNTDYSVSVDITTHYISSEDDGRVTLMCVKMRIELRSNSLQIYIGAPVL